MGASELILWAAGIIVAVIIGFLGVRKYNRRTQVQRSGRGSTSIQSGRDTNVK